MPSIIVLGITVPVFEAHNGRIDLVSQLGWSCIMIHDPIHVVDQCNYLDMTVSQHNFASRQAVLLLLSTTLDQS